MHFVRTFSLLLVLFFTLTLNGLWAQTPAKETVKIEVTGLAVPLVSIGEDEYPIENRTAKELQTIVLDELEFGSYTLLVKKKAAAGKFTQVKYPFTFRQGYNLIIKISATGAISKVETAKPLDPNTPVSDATYNSIFTQTKARTSSATRNSFLATKFNGSVGKFTTRQVANLITLVSSESFRLSLAKQAYKHVSDTDNYEEVSALLTSQTSKDDLNAYIKSVSGKEVNSTTADSKLQFGPAPISNDQFSAIYNEVVKESSSVDRRYYLMNYFGRGTSNYTSDQVAKWLSLLNNQEDRLAVAKAAYRGILDKNNFGPVFGQFSGPSRGEILAYIDAYHQNNQAVAIDATNFDKILNLVSAKANQTDRISLLTTILNTNYLHFTGGQARRLVELLTAEPARLDLAKKLYGMLANRNEVSMLGDSFYSQGTKGEFNDYVNTYNNLNSSGFGIVMPEAEYSSLYKSVADSWSPSTRYSLIDKAFEKTEKIFNVGQQKQLLQLINQEDKRLVLAKNGWDNILDTARYLQIAEMFTVASYKDEYIRFTQNELPFGNSNGTGNVATGGKQPMDDVSFRRLYLELQLTFGPGAKMDALSKIFGGNTYYFTSAQVKELIPFVSLEYNRVQLAKLSYDNVTDPGNFSVIYDLFTTAAARAEVEAFVKNAQK